MPKAIAPSTDFIDITTKEPLPQDIINVAEDSIEKPRRIIFTIQPVPSDEETYDGKFIPGRVVGNSPFAFSYQLRKDENGIYVTGFDIERISDSDLPEEEKQQLIKDVKIAQLFIERRKRISLRSDGSFWKNREFKVKDLGTIYDTSKSDDNLILYYNILGGGYPEIARSYEEATNDENEITPKKLYLTVETEEAERKFSGRKVQIKANAALSDLFDNSKLADILSLIYFLVKRKHGYTLNTHKEVLLNELADFIDGEDTKTDKKKRPQEFLDAVSLLNNDPDKLRITALYHASNYYGYLITDKERNIVNRNTGFAYGSSVNKAIDKLLDPRNIEELSWLKAKVQEKWIS